MTLCLILISVILRRGTNPQEREEGVEQVEDEHCLDDAV